MAKKPTKPSRPSKGRKPGAAAKATKAKSKATKAKAPARRPVPAKARKAALARTPAKRAGGKAKLAPKVAAWVRVQVVELRSAEPGIGPDALVARINERLAGDGLPPLLPIFIQPYIDWPRE